MEPGKWTLLAEDYIPIFRKLGITCVVRFNKRCYDRRRFTEGGISHVDLFYVDGGNPSEEILQRFLKICETTKASDAACVRVSTIESQVLPLYGPVDRATICFLVSGSTPRLHHCCDFGPVRRTLLVVVFCRILPAVDRVGVESKGGSHNSIVPSLDGVHLAVQQNSIIFFYGLTERPTQWHVPTKSRDVLRSRSHEYEHRFSGQLMSTSSNWPSFFPTLYSLEPPFFGYRSHVDIGSALPIGNREQSPSTARLVLAEPEPTSPCT